MSEKDYRNAFNVFIESDQFDLSQLGDVPALITHESLDVATPHSEQLQPKQTLTLTPTLIPLDSTDELPAPIPHEMTLHTRLQCLRHWLEQMLGRIWRR